LSIALLAQIDQFLANWLQRAFVRLACSRRALLAKEHSMRPYLASLILGVAVGVVYGLVKVRSPAPPAIALLGLLGMLAGEQAISLVRSHVLKSEAQLGASRDRGKAAMADDVRGAEQN
jgi:XapX domain-containing protein